MLLDWSDAVVPLFSGVVLFIVTASGSLWYNNWRTSKIQGYLFVSIYALTLLASCAVSVNESAHSVP